MKSFAVTLPLATLFATASLAQWLPTCSWNDCMGSWDGTSCDQASGWDCICGNATAIAQINTCVATSCTNTTDQEAIYGAIAQLCANNGVAVTNSQQATFSATSGGSLYPTITGRPGWGPGGNYDSAAWSSWVSQCSTAIGSAPSNWGPGSGSWGNGWAGGPGGRGGFGSGGAGPWGTKASGVNCDATASWTTWTAGWGPFSSWTGTWSGCSSTTATPIPATITTTITTNGQATVITGTTFGIQALAASTTGASSSSSSTTTNVGSSVRTFSICGAVAAAIFALMVAL